METDHKWIVRKHYEEKIQIYRSAWDFYLKFYTVFLTVNVAGIGLVVQHVDKSSRWPIAVAFIFQNVLSVGTSIFMVRYSSSVAADLKSIAVELLRTSIDIPLSVSSVALESPTPSGLPLFAGLANCLACISFCGCWFWISV